MLSKSQKLLLGNCSPDLIEEEDSKLSICTSISDKALEEKPEEDYGNFDFNIKCENLDISDIHMSDDYDSENGYSSDVEALGSSISSQVIKGSRRKRNLTSYDLNLKCEWRNCTYETDDDAKFHEHVSHHIPDLEIKTLDNGEELYACLWAECSYTTEGVKEIQRHVTYHSYHTKLKNIGEKVVQEWDLPKCTYGSETRNMIPEKIDRMVCEWDRCYREFSNVQVFLYHIQTHINETCYDKKEKIKCKWDGCTMTSNMPSRVRLADHLRSHTKERLVGCPTCGNLFSSNTKLNDHCKRQLPNELVEFECSQCYKHFPSLRLLKDHMRGHINFFKCCYCDMTCTSRHTLSAHIRYKHLDSKPFICSMCGYKCKTQNDLKKHLAIHDPKTRLKCEETNCNYSCQTKATLLRHMMEEHQGTRGNYCCHIADCTKKFKRGKYLTKHLTTKHFLTWPAGHSKFMYHRQEDGNYKLQTMRYESLKLFDENKTDISTSKNNFTHTSSQVGVSRSFKVSSIESDANNGVSQVFISIEDESGNTINCCTAPEVIGEKIPKNAMIIASAENYNSDQLS